jgi:hypothetical protein
LDQWENSVYSEIPEVFANSKKVPRTPSLFFFLWRLLCSPALPSAPLPPAVSAAHRRSSPFPGATSCSGKPHASLSLFPGPTFLPRWPFPRAPRQPEHRPAATSLPPCPLLMTAPLPFLFCPVAPADSTKPISLPFHCRAHPEPRTPPSPPSSTPATSCSLWAAHPSPPRTTIAPWEASPHLTDTPKPLPVAGLPPEPPRRRYRLAGELLSPSNPSLRSFSVQFNCTNSFLSSCCSFWTGALPHFLAGTLSPTSSPPPLPRPPWEPHLRSSPSLPKTPRRCALSS